MATRRVLVGMTTLIAVAAIWYVATTLTGAVSPGRFPSPGDTWAALRQISVRGYAGGTLIEHAFHSVRLVVLGFAVAVVTGTALGLAMGWSRRVEALVNPIFLLIRPIPPLAWIPLAILWLGLGDAAKIMVIWFAAFVPAVINTFTGVRTIERPVIEAAQMLGTPPLRFLREVVVPAASPMMFTGLRLSLQATWTTLVAAELVGALFGLGSVLNLAQQDLHPGMILVGMLAVALCGWLTTLALIAFERRALAWNQAAAGGAG